jgi:hypothetical protein
LRFSGTSSASPIVAGAAACLQGRAKAVRRKPLTPAHVRSILRKNGTPPPVGPDVPLNQNIRPLPNLPKAFRQLKRVSDAQRLGGGGRIRQAAPRRKDEASVELSTWAASLRLPRGQASFRKGRPAQRESDRPHGPRLGRDGTRIPLRGRAQPGTLPPRHSSRGLRPGRQGGRPRGQRTAWGGNGRCPRGPRCRSEPLLRSPDHRAGNGYSRFFQ